MLGWLVACGGSGDDGRDPPPVHSGAAPGAPCAVTDADPLRVRCAYGGAAATLAITVDGATRTFTGADGVVVGWGYPESTRLDVALTVDGAEAWSGPVVTGVLPDDAALTLTELVPGAPRADHLLLSTACGGPARPYVVRADGAVVWVGETGVSGGLTAFDDTPDGVVTLSGRRWVREIRWDGSIGLDAQRVAGGESFPHHAVDVRDGRVVVLDTRPRTWPDGVTYLDDGVAEVRGDRLENVFLLGDVVDPQGRTSYPPAYWTGVFPGAVDAFHVNSVDLLDDGGFLLSAKHLDAVLRVGGDGALRWAVAGSGYSPDLGAAALAPTNDAGFEFPHHANLAPGGHVLLFDNGRDFANSTVLELAIDEVARTVTAVRRWDLGQACPVQGSAYGLPDGTVVATCAVARTIWELDDGGVHRQVRVDCANGEEGAMVVRAEPIDFP